MNHSPEDFPVASSMANEILSLPIHGTMPDSQVQYVITQLADILRDAEVRSYDGPQLKGPIRAHRLRRDCA